MNSLPLADLEAFAAVAEVRSFRRAASLRAVSASSLSEAVRRLEARLETRLLNRTTRSVTPTEAGQRLLERVAPMLGEISGALDQVRSSDESPAGSLRLNVPTFVAREIIPAIAAAFLKEFPGVTLEIEAKDSFVDVFAEGFDAGIRYDESLDLDMIAVPLGPRQQRFAAAASPDYLKARGVPAHPRDLLHHSCIRHKFDSGRISNWEFERDAEIVRITPNGPLVANTIDMELRAALAGVGILSTFEDLLRTHLESGALVEVLRDWQQPFSGPYLYYPSRRHMPAPLRAFVDFVKGRRLDA
ncbi:LysR family transcriptional regulator [Rhizobium sp. KVB221]|uniref:HTH-type transcriptional regulator TtuA n=1 Tax=Rhizobium setariae TaxID=2801340 RepID=A0A936YPG1_9HYPH|nr:LysR family transcriptional regulator [Rhizobium setariae]MBL0374384.1 LysR family transcriptional regulator [Rhizobium setariae]